SSGSTARSGKRCSTSTFSGASRTSARPPGGGCSSTTRSAPTIPSAISRPPRSASNTRKVLLLRCVLDGEAYDASRQVDPARQPPRWHREQALASQIGRVWQENRQAYGARKVWRQFHRGGVKVARFTVERLMR